MALSLIASPHYGGTYQYNASIARGLAPLAREGWELTAFVLDPAWRAVLPESMRVVRVRARFLGTIASELYRTVDRSPAGARRSGRFNPFARAIDASGCDLAVFPSQEKEAYLTRKRALVAIHDLMHRYERSFEEYGGAEFARRERHYGSICEGAAGILVDSELGKRQVVESYGADPGKIFVLPFTPSPYLADASETDVRKAYGLPQRYLFYPAHFWEHKNHLRLLEALAIARSRGVDASLVLCGGRKNAYRRVLERIEELGLSSHVRILGYVPDAHMYSLYKEAVATVFVSLIGPTSIPPLEAMLVGSPLVVSNAYAMPEQVGDAALLVDGRDPADIAEKIERIWTDASLRASLAARGRERASRWTDVEFGDRLRAIVRTLALR